jgi:hypothetical protein
MDLSPYVVSSQNISLLDLDRGIYTTPANLPAACQTLYGNVAGPEIVLDITDFPYFSKAIQRSVSTKGLLGHFWKPSQKNLALRISQRLTSALRLVTISEILPEFHMYSRSGLLAIILQSMIMEMQMLSSRYAPKPSPKSNLSKHGLRSSTGRSKLLSTIP